MKYLIFCFLLGVTTAPSLASTKEEMNFFDIKKAILVEMDKRINADPNDKKLQENRKCIEATKDHVGLDECKQKMKSGK